jgi:hypothetical protein
MRLPVIVSPVLLTFVESVAKIFSHAANDFCGASRDRIRATDRII